MNETLYNAFRLNDAGRGPTWRQPAATIDVPGPITVLSECDMIQLTIKHQLDPDAMMQAFEDMGGPFGGRIRFVQDAEGGVWACDPDGLKPDPYANLVAAVMGGMAGMKKKRDANAK